MPISGTLILGLVAFMILVLILDAFLEHYTGKGLNDLVRKR